MSEYAMCHIGTFYYRHSLCCVLTMCLFHKPCSILGARLPKKIPNCWNTQQVHT